MLVLLYYNYQIPSLCSVVKRLIFLQRILQHASTTQKSPKIFLWCLPAKWFSFLLFNIIFFLQCYYSPVLFYSFCCFSQISHLCCKLILNHHVFVVVLSSAYETAIHSIVLIVCWKLSWQYKNSIICFLKVHIIVKNPPKNYILKLTFILQWNKSWYFKYY